MLRRSGIEDKGWVSGFWVKEEKGKSAFLEEGCQR